MTESSTLSLGALVSHPIQYQAPLFRTIADRKGVDLAVYFCDDRGIEPAVDPGFGKEIVWDQPLLEGYDYKFLSNWGSGSGGSLFGDVNPGVISELRESGHDALWVHGYTTATNWLAFLTAATIDLPVIFRGESTLLNRPPKYVRPFKRLALGSLTRLVDAYGVIGTRNREFYRAHRVPEKRLFDAPYTVHNEYFQSVRQDLPPTDELRADIGVPDRPTVLFVGKLVARKRPMVLLDAFVETTTPGEATLLFVGDGDRREDLERAARANGRMDDIVFVGFQNQSDLPKFYELGDLFVLPSVQENWGLVVNEAMNFELPIVSTDAVGSAADLVDHWNGRVVPPDDVDALAEAIREVLDGNREQMGERSLKRIDGWGIDETAKGILRAAEYASNG